MKQCVPFLLGACAFVFSSCGRELRTDYYINAINETDKDCVVTFDYTESHSVHHGSANHEPPFTVKAGCNCTENFCDHDPCRPSEIFSSFTVVNTDGDTVYHASPVVDADWEHRTEFCVDSEAETTMKLWLLHIK